MSNISVTLLSGQTAVVGVASSRSAYEVEVSSGVAGSNGVSVVDASIVNGALNITLSDASVINAGAVSGNVVSMIEYDAEVSNRVEVDGTGARVRLNTQLDGNLQTTWIFGEDGTLTLPNGTAIRDIGSTVGENPSAGIGIGYGNFNISTGSALNDWALFQGAQLIKLSATDTVYLESNNVVTIGVGAEGPTWTYGQDGSLSFPDSTIQYTAWTGRIEVAPLASLAGEYGDLAGQLRLTPDGDTLICAQDWQDNSFAATGSDLVTTNQDFLTGQTGGLRLVWTVTAADYTTLVNAFLADGWNGTDTGFTYSDPTQFTITSTDLPNPETPREVIQLGIDNGGDMYFHITYVSGDPTSLPTGSQATVIYNITAGTQPNIWTQLNVTGSPAELNDELNGNKLLISPSGDLVLTDSVGTLTSSSGGGYFRGLMWDYGEFNGGDNAYISSGDGSLLINAGGSSSADDVIILRTGVNGVTTLNDWMLAGTNLTLPNEAIIKSNAGSAGAGVAVQLPFAIGDTTPAIDNSNTLDGIPTTFFDSNDWIGIGTIDSNTYPTITFADGTTTTITGVNTDAYGDNGFLVFADTLTKTGSQVWPITIYSYDYVAPEGASVGISVNGNEWKFNENNKLVFPDGTEQTTAYVTSVSSPLFVVINSSGQTAWSTDGASWTVGSQLTLNGPGPENLMAKVAVADTYITYIGYDADSGLSQQLWSASNYNTNPTLTGPTATGGSFYAWNDIEHGGNYTVAVGYYSETDGAGGNLDPIPVFAYTQNGTSWTLGNTDPAYQSAFTPGNFQSVWYGNSGWLIVASSNAPMPGGAGAFWVTDPTQALSEGSYVAFNGLATPPNIDSVVYTGDRWWVRDNDTGGYYVSDGANPQTSTWTGVDHVAAGQQYGFGTPSFYEDAGGTIGAANWFVVSSNHGHVLASSDGGETWVASVPLPYTGAIATATEATTCKVTFSGPSPIAAPVSDGEEIVVSNATPSAYNGTYYAKYDGVADDGSYELYSDVSLTIPVDSSAFGTFVSADVLFNHGQYIDAVGFGLGKFIVGNDDEQLFVSTDLSTWTKVNDQNNSFDYWDDISFNANWGAGISAVSRLTNGNYSLQLGSSGATTLPGALILPTDYPVDGSIGSGTALDLTKQVQVLTGANADGFYALANGTEGQIMYFTWLTNSVFVVIDNARVKNSSTGAVEVRTNYSWAVDVDSANQEPRTMAMAIFVDGAWSLMGGATD